MVSLLLACNLLGTLAETIRSTAYALFVIGTSSRIIRQTSRCHKIYLVKLAIRKTYRCPERPNKEDGAEPARDNLHPLTVFHLLDRLNTVATNRGPVGQCHHDVQCCKTKRDCARPTTSVSPLTRSKKDQNHNKNIFG